MNQAIKPETLQYLRENTSAYIRLIHGEELETYQNDICDLIDRHDRVSIKACHAVGKTFLMGRITDALLKCNPGTIIITTAPTYRQVVDLLWSEIREAHGKSPKIFRHGKINETMLKLGHETGSKAWYARGFSTKTNKSGTGQGQGTNSTFQGYHGSYMTVIIFDEATGVEPIVWKMAEGLMTSGVKVKWICIANPTSRNCKFFDTFKAKNWVNYSITCFDSPNLKINGINNRQDILKEYNYLMTLSQEDYLDRIASYKIAKPHLIGLRWVMEQMHESGMDHPLFKSKVLGEFPDEDASSLIPESTVRLAINRECEPTQDDFVFIGVDVARFGTDKSVFTEFVGWHQTRIEVMQKLDTNEVAGLLVDFIKSNRDYGGRKVRVGIDGGFSHGVIDAMYLATGQKSLNDHNRMYASIANTLKDVEILEIHFAGQDWVKYHYGWKDQAALMDPALDLDKGVQEDRETYANFKAKMYDLLARDLRHSIDLMDKQVYVDILPTIVTVPTKKEAKLLIESKNEYKDRTGESSPDECDSLALANFARYFARRPMGMLEALA